jgi:hypothetical protein
MVADIESFDASSTTICVSDARRLPSATTGTGKMPGAQPIRAPSLIDEPLAAEPTRELRVVSLNLRATPNRRATALAPLIALLDQQHPDVMLLKECRKGWTELVCQELGLDGVSTHQLLEGTPRLPADWCAIAVRTPLRILRAWPVEQRMFIPAAIERLIGPDTPSGYEFAHWFPVIWKIPGILRIVSGCMSLDLPTLRHTS